MAEKSATAFRTISEVAAEIGVPQHVLRFWETKFATLRPMKRGGNRRYYRPEDIELLRTINRLLYADGYTIKGVQKLLKDKALPVNAAAPPALTDDARPEPVMTAEPPLDQGFVGALQGIRDRLAAAVQEARGS